MKDDNLELKHIGKNSKHKKLLEHEKKDLRDLDLKITD
jgi:hypothetical protein